MYTDGIHFTDRKRKYIQRSTEREKNIQRDIKRESEIQRERSEKYIQRDRDK